MSTKKVQSSKVLWISPKKLAFEWETDVGEHFPWGYQVIGKRKVLVIAEEGKDLLFLGNGENSGYSENDLLCWFCQNSINLERLGHAPTCLLGNVILNVTICKDFDPGPSFGDCASNDIGVRLEMAENVFPRIQWQDCNYCRFLNTENVIKIVGNEEYGHVFEDPSQRYCEIFHDIAKTAYGRTCPDFKLTNEPAERNSYQNRIKKLLDYINSLKEIKAGN